MLQYFLLWFPMLIIAMINGMIREKFIRSFLPYSGARQLSTIMLIVFFAFYIWFVIRKFPPGSTSQSWIIGVFWVILTLLFEFGFGLLQGTSFKSLLAEYNIFKGRLWILVPLSVLLFPYLFYVLKTK